jgi:hypothetical protein
MKKLLVIAIALTAINAQATRARVTALANSPHLIDTQTVYNNPADVHWLGDYATLESGTTDNFTTAQARNANSEGMIVRSMGDAKLGLSLGHNSSNAASWGLRNAALGVPAGLAKNQQNPLELTYGAKAGDMGWAATLVYSNYVDKTAVDAKESSAGVRFGARTGNWDAALRIGLTNTVQTAADGKFTGTTSIGVNGGYMWDQIYFNGEVSTAGFKLENNVGTETGKYNATSIRLGAMTAVKKDGSEFFYGASLAQSTAKEDVSDTKVESLGLPVFIGMEVDAASWLTIRGSVTQTTQLLHNSKTTAAGTTTAETAPGAGDTTVAAGAGLKFNKITVDGTLQANSGATVQQLNGNSFLTQLGMTYMF